MRVFIYFNLHRKCYSVKALEGADKGRVIAHCNSALVAGATFKVSEAGRQRVIREKRKNVHAGVVGDWLGAEGFRISYITQNGSAITYNPYRYSSFVHRYGEHPIERARLVALTTHDKKPSIHIWD